jgi:hypothetical protein
MSLISSFATGASVAAARSQSHAPPRPDDTSSMNIPLSAPEPPGMPAALGAVVALVHIFAQLAFTPYSLSDRNRTLAVRVFRILVELVTTAKSARARLAILQFFFRLRVDRDHRLYSVYNRYDRLGSIAALAGLVGRVDVPQVGVSRRTKSQTRKRSSRPVRVPQSATGATCPAVAMRGPLARRPAGVALEFPIASCRRSPLLQTPSLGNRCGPCPSRCPSPFPNRTRRPMAPSRTTLRDPGIASCCPCRRSSSPLSSSYLRKKTGRSCRTCSATYRRCSRTSTFSVDPSHARRSQSCWSRCATKSPRASWRRVS